MKRLLSSLCTILILGIGQSYAQVSPGTLTPGLKIQITEEGEIKLLKEEITQPRVPVLREKHPSLFPTSQLSKSLERYKLLQQVQQQLKAAKQPSNQLDQALLTYLNHLQQEYSSPVPQTKGTEIDPSVLSPMLVPQKSTKEKGIPAILSQDAKSIAKLMETSLKGKPQPASSKTGATPQSLPNLTYLPNNSFLSVSGTVATGRLTIANTGFFVAGPFSVVFSLYTTDLSQFYPIGQFDYALLLGQGVAEIPINFNAQSLAPPGTYYLGFVVDAYNSVAETNENDNANYWTEDIVIKGNDPNLAFVSSGTSISVSGTQVSFSSRIRNTGDQSTGRTSELAYLLFDNDNVYPVGQRTIPRLNAGQSTNDSYNVDVSNPNLQIPPGTYSIASLLDATQVIDESNEDDNVFQSNRSVTLSQQQTKPNLAFVSSGTSISVSGTQVSFSSRIRNTGNQSTGGTSILAYLLYDDSNVYPVGQRTIPSLSAGQSTNDSYSVDVSTPNLQIPPGTYSIASLVDATQVIDESSEDDNGFFGTQPVTISTAPSQPNLAFASSGTSISVSGTRVSFSSRIINSGNQATGATVELAYLLFNDNTDIYPVGQKSISSLAAGQSTTDTYSVDVSNPNFNIPPGTYSIVSLIDATQLVDESSEEDNGFFGNQPVTISTAPSQPNLAFASSGTSISVSGTQVSFNSRIINSGNQATGATVELAYLLFNDNTDIYPVGQKSIPSLGAGQSTTDTYSVDVSTPSFNIPPGTYSIASLIDATQLVDESNEEDNGFFGNQPVTINAAPSKPNLTFDPSSIGIQINGTQAAYTLSIINNGSASSGQESLLLYYLYSQSKDSLYVLDLKTLPVLAPSQSFNGNAQVDALNAPQPIPAGTYQIGFFVDPTDDLDESDETDNGGLFNNEQMTIPAVEQKPNLSINSTATSVQVSGTSVQYTLSLNNTGNAATGASAKLIYFLSSSGNVPQTIGEKTIPNIPVGGNFTDTYAVDVSNPSLNLSAGVYQLGIRADADNEIDESNEQDNTYLSNATVTVPPQLPNLTYVSNTLSAAVAGTQVSYTLSVQNIGQAASGSPSTVAYYLYQNGQEQNQIGQRVIPSVAPAQSTNANFTIDVANPVLNVAPGTYQLAFAIDANDDIDESNELDNKRIVPNASVVVPTPLPLPVAAFTVSKTNACVDEVLSFSSQSTGTIDSYQWNFPGGTPSSSADKDPQVSYAQAGIYSATLIISNATGSDTLTRSNYLSVEDCGAKPSWEVVQTGENHTILFTTDLYTDIEGSPISSGDYIGAFYDDQGTLKPAGILQYQAGQALSMAVFGDDNATPAKDGFAIGETFTWRVWLASTQTEIAVNASYLDTGIGGISNTDQYQHDGLSLVDSLGAQSDPVEEDPFEFTPTALSGILYGQVQINGVAAEAGDWIAAYDSDNNCAGAAALILNAGIAYINLPIYGDDPATSADEGINPGENFTLRLYDASAQAYLAYPDTSNPEAFTEWQNTNGAAIPAYNDIARVFNFTTSTQTGDPFSFTPTALSGIFYGQVQINGVAAEAEDWIAAFDEDNNCAGASQLIINAGIAYINLPIYGDDPNTSEVDEGMSAGESFTIRVYDASAQQILEYPNAASPLLFDQWVNMNGGTLPAYGDFTKVYNFAAQGGGNTQDIVILSPGINFISLDVNPEKPGILDVFASLRAGNLQNVSTFDNGAKNFDPTKPIFLNTLAEVKDGFGYVVRVNTQDTLVVDGTPIATDFRLPLNSGYNLVAYLPQSPAAVTDYFSEVISNGDLLSVSGFENGVVSFDPTKPPFLNTLSELKNGYGYGVNIKGTANAAFRRNRDGKYQSANSQDAMFVSGQWRELQSVTLPAQAWVSIVDEAGNEWGKMDILHEGYLMTTALYADDPQTIEREGITPGTRLYLAYNGHKLGQSFLFEGAMTSLHLAFNEAIPGVFNLYPNPFSQVLNLQYEAPQEERVTIRVLNLMGQEVYRHEEQAAAVFHSFSWQPQDLVEGIYLLELLSGDQVRETRKIMYRR